MSFTVAAAVSSLLIPLQVCPVAPPGIQVYVDQITGYVLFGVIALFLVAAAVSIGGIVVGKIFGMQHASKAGVIGLAVAVLAAVAYQVAPGIIASILGSGCIG